MLEDFISNDLVDLNDIDTSDPDGDSMFNDSTYDATEGSNLYSENSTDGSNSYAGEETDSSSSLKINNYSDNTYIDKLTNQNAGLDDFSIQEDVPDDLSANGHESDTVMTDPSNDKGNQQESAQNKSQHRLFRKSEPSFTGVGRCSYCGCGSFVGIGNVCEDCGHSYKAHTRYKK